MKSTLIIQRTPELTEAMRQATMMFLALHKKSLSLEEGFSFISLWETALLARHLIEAEPETPVVPEKTPEPEQSLPSSRTLSLKKQKPAVKPDPQPRKDIVPPEYPDDDEEEEETEDDNRGNVAPPTSSYIMPDLDSPDYDAALPDSCKLPPVQRFDSTFWQTGYRFKITVKAKSYTDSHEDYSVQTLERPTQEEFDKHYTKFLTGDFYVHVYESRWVPGEGYQSIRITDQYCSYRNHKPATAMAQKVRPESLVDIVDWEDEPDAPYRIAFYDDRVHRLNYVYFRERPTERDIRTYDQTRFHATLQRRPEGV